MEQSTLDEVGGILEKVFAVMTQLNENLDIQAELIIPIILIVGIISGLLKIRTRFPDSKNSILVTLTMFFGMLGEYAFGEFETTREMLKSGIILGSLSAVSYQYIKPMILKIGKSFVPWFADTFISSLKAKVRAVLDVESKGGTDGQ